MLNKYTAEVVIDMAGGKYTLSFDWSARAAFKSKYNDDEVISRALSKGADEPQILADLVAACLKKHHPEITPEFIFNNSPPIIPLSTALQNVILYSLWGPDGPPSEQQDSEDIKKNP